MNEKIFLVIPTIRNLSFLEEWQDQFIQCHLLVVEDHKSQEISTPSGGFLSIQHFSWNDIKNDFGIDEWIFSRQNAGIRSYGFWKAYQQGATSIITLDDDCFPVEADFVQQHILNLQSVAPEGWFPTFPHPDYVYTRGFPYGIRNKRRVVISHGLWSNKMDMDAQTQMRIGEVNIPAYPRLHQFVPPGQYFPMSSMNLAFVRDVAPLMYFPLMGKDPEGKVWGYDRFDDIWAGIFAKKIIDHLGWSAVNGSPFVDHRKASDVATNLIKEKSGIEVNEFFWKAVNSVVLTKETPASCFRELNSRITYPRGAYFNKLQEAISLWLDLF